MLVDTTHDNDCKTQLIDFHPRFWSLVQGYQLEDDEGPKYKNVEAYSNNSLLNLEIQVGFCQP